MDEYEVDLMDYLQVMWKGKWIIIACFILAVAISAAIMCLEQFIINCMNLYRLLAFLTLISKK